MVMVICDTHRFPYMQAALEAFPDSTTLCSKYWGAGDPREPTAVWGGKCPNIVETLTAAGQPCYVFENGVFREQAPNHIQISVGGLNKFPETAPDGHLERIGVTVVKPGRSKKQPSTVLLCSQVANDAAHGYSAEDLCMLYSTIRRVWEAAGVTVVKRNHPRQPYALVRQWGSDLPHSNEPTLAEALDSGAYDAVVTLTSTSMIQALTRGIAVYAQPDSWCTPAGNCYEPGSYKKSAAAALKFLNAVASRHYNIEEVRKGLWI